MLTIPQRHDLLVLSSRGREYAWEHRESPAEADSLLWRTYPDIPAIFTGQYSLEENNLLRIGFSYPMRTAAGRCRIAAYVPQDLILRVISPWELLKNVPAGTGALAEALAYLRAQALDLRIPLGMFGSAALQKVTGFDYLHARSDLDLVVGMSGAEQLQAFGQAMYLAEKQFNVHVDAELKLSRFQYVKLKELLCTQKTVMIKGGTEPQLMSRREIWDLIQAADIAFAQQN